MQESTLHGEYEVFLIVSYSIVRTFWEAGLVRLVLAIYNVTHMINHAVLVGCV